MCDSLVELFLDSCMTGDAVKVRAALTLGVNIKASNKNGFTALHFAIWTNQPEVVDVLLEIKDSCLVGTPDVNVVNIHGDSPLHVACAMGRAWAVSRLATGPCLEVNSPGWAGMPPLTLAVRKGDQIPGCYLRLGEATYT